MIALKPISSLVVFFQNFTLITNTTSASAADNKVTCSLLSEDAALINRKTLLCFVLTHLSYVYSGDVVMTLTKDEIYQV